MTAETDTNVTRTPDSDADVLQRSWGWFFALGAAMVVLGAMAISLPGVASLAVTLVLGWMLLIGGVVQGVHAFTVRRWDGFFAQAIVAVLYVGVGLMLVVNPLAGMFTLTLVVAAFLLVEGLFRLVMALQVRPSTNWGWIALSGVVSIVLAGLIWAELPGDALWIIGLLVGVNIIFNGFSMIMLAMAASPSWGSWFGQNNQMTNNPAS
ncbi:MAG: HdeD family acid-resistance protein [Pirellulales bacterium]|nr:HdeD family acid-resistance protein [Pirellulales bacterium]